MPVTELLAQGIDFAEYARVETQMIENIHTLIRRDRSSVRRLEVALNLGKNSMARKLNGEGSLYYMQVRAIAHHFSVTMEELEGTLPTREVWEARRQGGEGISGYVPEPRPGDNGALSAERVAGSARSDWTVAA